MALLGIDGLGFASKYFKLDAVARGLPSGFGFGVFDGKEVFGDVVPKLRKLMARRAELGLPPIPWFRIHASWSDSHKPTAMSILQRRLPTYQRLAEEFPSTTFWVSHSCEPQGGSASDMKERLLLVQRLCPSCRVVQSVYKSPVIPGFQIERHGNKANAGPGEIVSYDGGSPKTPQREGGEGLFDVNAVEWVSRSQDGALILAWDPLCNGTEKKKKPRPERRQFPSERHIKGLARLLQPKAPLPPPMAGARGLRKPEVWKTWAEQDDNPSRRESKPVLIIKSNTRSAVTLITHMGQRIGKLPYYGPFSGGLSRFYSGMPEKGGIDLYAHEIAERSLQMSGHEGFYIKDGKRIIGPLDSFRSGFFQSEI